MIKNFFIKHSAVLLTVLVTSVVTSAVASGYFVIKNEKENAKKQVEVLQKSIETLQAKTENPVKNEELNKVEGKSSTSLDVVTQQVPVNKKTVEVAPVKIKEIEKVEEELVSCLTYVDTTVEVSKEECDVIKQKNERSKEIDAEYSNCVNSLQRGLINCHQEAIARGVSSDWCENTWDINNGKQECLDVRSSQIKKVWK